MRQSRAREAAIESVLVTGGTGTLGRLVVDALRERGATVRVLSRRSQRQGSPDLSWTIGDLRKGEGLDEALRGVDTVMHCATGRNDVSSARHLLQAAANAERPHVAYISIVGVDRVPFSLLPLSFSWSNSSRSRDFPGPFFALPSSTPSLRARVERSRRHRSCSVPSQTSFQPIDVRVVAERLVELASTGPAGRAPDVGGPEVLRAHDLAASYLEAMGRRRRIAPVYLPGRTFAAFRSGGHLAPDHAVGTVTFETYLAAISG